MKLWFGKHEGEELSDVPIGYLRWLTEKFIVHPDARLAEAISKEELDRIVDRRKDLVSAAEDELIEREENSIDEVPGA